MHGWTCAFIHLAVALSLLKRRDRESCHAVPEAASNLARQQQNHPEHGGYGEQLYVQKLIRERDFREAPECTGVWMRGWHLSATTHLITRRVKNANEVLAELYLNAAGRHDEVILATAEIPHCASCSTSDIARN